jgi:hypothetical protein
VTYLASEECSVSGEVYTCGGGRVARVFIGVATGFVDKELTAESIRDNLDTVRSEDGYIIPGNLNEELVLTLKALS